MILNRRLTAVFLFFPAFFLFTEQGSYQFRMVSFRYEFDRRHTVIENFTYNGIAANFTYADRIEHLYPTWLIKATQWNRLGERILFNLSIRGYGDHLVTKGNFLTKVVANVGRAWHQILSECTEWNCTHRASNVKPTELLSPLVMFYRPNVITTVSYQVYDQKPIGNFIHYGTVVLNSIIVKSG